MLSLPEFLLLSTLSLPESRLMALEAQGGETMPGGSFLANTSDNWRHTAHLCILSVFLILVNHGRPTLTILVNSSYFPKSQTLSARVSFSVHPLLHDGNSIS